MNNSEVHPVIAEILNRLAAGGTLRITERSLLLATPLPDDKQGPGVYVLDKRRYPAGPWAAEPDRVEWRSHGYPCLILRNRMMGALTCYVGVPPGHPLFEQDPFKVIANRVSAPRPICFASHCQPFDSEHPICHVPQPGELDDVWWFGWDYGHGYDLVPGRLFEMPAGLESMVRYTTVDEAKGDAELVAAQVAAIAKEPSE